MKPTEFVMAYPIKLLTLDPHRMEDVFSMSVVTQINSSLLRYLSDGEIEANIAKSWSISNDGLTYNIKLNQKKFSNGEMITSKDVVKSLKRIFIKKASISVDIAGIKGVSKYHTSNNANDIEISEVAPDEIQIVLEKPNSVLLKQLATPDTAILKLDENFEINKDNISSGKYKIISQTPTELNLEFWNPDQSTSPNPPQKIKYLLLGDNDTRVDLSLEGKIDFIGLNSTMTQELEKLKMNEWKETLGGLSQENFIVLNPKKVPLLWRQYFFNKFSTDDLLKELNFSNKAPSYGYVPTALQGSISTPFPKTNPVIKDNDLSPLDLEISYFHFSGVDEVLNHLKAKWSHPKLQVKFKKIEVDEFMQSIYDKNLQAYIITKGLDYPDAMANLAYFKSDLKENFFLVEDLAVDQKIIECSMTSNKKSSCFIEIQKMIYDKNIVLPLFYGSNKLEYYSKKIKTFPSHPLGLQFVTFDQIEMK